jgi:hypothetical protein
MPHSFKHLQLLLGIMLLVSPVAAQQFTVTPDSIEGSGYLDSLAVFNSLIVNLWDQPSKILWLNTPDVPEDWTVEICQGTMLCWPPWVMSDTLKMRANGRDTLEVKFRAAHTTGTGHATILLVSLADTTIRQEITFTYHARDLAVPGTAEESKTDELTFKDNLPNPFSAVATLRYHLPRSTTVKIALFDTSGRFISTFFNGAVEAGDHNVNTDFPGVSTGIYFLKLDAKGLGSISKRVVLVR